MNYRCVPRFATGLVISALILVSTTHAQVTYDVIPLPARVGLAHLGSEAISNRGSVVGTSVVNPQAQGFIWRNGKLIFLPALGGTCSYGNGISNSEHVVGASCLAGDTVYHATLWQQGQNIDLDTFGGTGSSAYRVNRHDDVVGGFFLADGTFHAFFWSNGTWSDLGGLGGSFTFPSGINDSGVVSGQSDISNIPDPVFGIPPFHGLLWQAGVLTDFGPIFGADFNYAADVDAGGRIAGTSDLAGNLVAHAFLWNHGTVKDLSTFPGDQVSWAMGMNNLGQVVGTSGLRDPDQSDGPPLYTMLCPCRAVLWQKNQVIDLNAAVPPRWSLQWASAINDKGEIVARAFSPINGPVLLVPRAGHNSVSTSNTQATSVSHSSSVSTYTGPRRLQRDRQGHISVH